MTYFPWAPCHVQAGRALPCQCWQCLCQLPIAPAALAQGFSPSPVLGQVCDIARCPPHPGLAGTTKGWLSSPHTVSIIFINSCSTSRSQGLSSSRPKHRIWAGSCSKRGCEQCCLSCRLFPLTAYSAIWVAFEESDLCLLNLAFFFYLKNKPTNKTTPKKKKKPNNPPKKPTSNPYSLANCKGCSMYAVAVLAGRACRQLAVALEGVCSSVYQMSVNSAAFC